MDRGSLRSRLDEYLAPAVEALDFSGVVMLEREGVVTTATYGLASLELEVPHSLEHVYWAGSISKLFTRAAVLALEREGRLRLDDLLATYLPEYPGADVITVRQLVEHRAGIARDLFLGAEGVEPHTTEEIVDLVAGLPPVAAPGETESYSNNGYRILARVLEIAGEDGFASIVRSRVFDPLGMSSTLMPDLLDVVPGMASGYVAGPGSGTLRRAAYYNVVNEPGAGAFYTSPTDLLAFCRALPLEAGDLVPGETGEEGWTTPRWTGHNGLGNGFASLCYRFPDEDAGIVVLANIETGLFGRLRQDLTRLLFDQPVATPPTPPPGVPLDREAAQWVVGNYEFMPGAPIMVRLAAHGLEVSAGDAFHPLAPLGDDAYFMRLKYAVITFAREAGTATALTWQQDGQEFTLQRLG